MILTSVDCESVRDNIVIISTIFNIIIKLLEYCLHLHYIRILFCIVIVLLKITETKKALKGKGRVSGG